MELKEALRKLTIATGPNAFCKKKDTGDESGTVVIDGIKGSGDAETLRTNMKNVGTTIFRAGIKTPYPPDPKTRPDPEGWDLFSCDKTVFPYQTHHLIPEKQLPDHAVTVWLTDSPKEEHPTYKLTQDTRYDTNAAENGYFMPFAATTHQWKKTKSGAKHSAICYEMMRRTELQLHQGPHSRRNYTDHLEQEGIETAPYKGAVDQLLTLLAARTEQHVKACEACKGEASPKIQVRPLLSVVRFTHYVSELLKTMTIANRIFVSKRSAAYFDTYRKGGIIMHPTTAFVEDDS
jgi:hypothetical protein